MPGLVSIVAGALWWILGTISPAAQPDLVPSFGYAGPGTIPGVGFWQRVAARIIDTLVHSGVVHYAGVLFGVLAASPLRVGSYEPERDVVPEILRQDFGQPMMQRLPLPNCR